MPNVAVVILNFNGRHHLETFLPSVIKYNSNYEIIIADNASTDDSITYLENNYPMLRLIKLSRNEGFSKGYNLALKQIKADIYVLLNSDVEVTPNWCAPIVDLLNSDPQIAACQPKILSYTEKNKFEYAGAGGGFIDTLGYPFCRGRIFDTLEEDKGQYNDIKEIFWASGACLFIKAKAFHETGGFDDHFFAHMEEIDLCWRLHLAGYKVCYNGKSEVYHLGGGTLHKTNPRKTFLNFRNSLLMMAKNSSSKDIIWKLPLRTILDIIAGLKILISDNKENLFALLKAHASFYSIIWKYIFNKKNIKSKNKIKKLNIIYSRLIVFEYYIRSKKYFGELGFNQA